MDAKKIQSPPFHYSSNNAEYFLSKDSWDSVAVVSRENCSISVKKKVNSGKVKDCFGFLGIMHLENGSYIVVITEARYIAILNNCYIFMVFEVEFLPFSTIKDAEAIKEFKEFIASSCFYFSYYYDLTNALQRIFTLRDSLN